MVLEKLDDKREISSYINSPGGEVDSGLAIFDFIHFMHSPIRITLCIGTSISMAAILFLSENKWECFPMTN